MRAIRCFALLVVLLGLMNFAASQGAAAATPGQPATDSPYAVQVAGQTVAVEKVGSLEPIYYGRMFGQPTARIRVTVNAPGAAGIAVKPAKLVKDLKVTGNVVEFEANGPGPRVVTAQANGQDLPPLAILMEPAAETAKPPQGKQFALKDFGVVPSLEKIQTEGIQKALDACTAAAGGVVVFEPGVYRSGSLRIRSNTHVFFQPGAYLVGSANFEDYQPTWSQEGNDLAAAGDPKGSNDEKKKTGEKSLIYFDRAQNSSITGFGVIDGQGDVIRGRDGKNRARVMMLLQSKNIKLQDVILSNSAAWTLHPKDCDNLIIDNLKILSDWGVLNTDGIDPDSSRNVTITRYFGHCGDDGIAIKTTDKGKIFAPTSDIIVRDSVVMSKKTALKIGTESTRDIKNVLFENCSVINSSRGLALHLFDGGVYENVIYRNIDVDLKEYAKEPATGEPVKIALGKRKPNSPAGTMKGIRFEKINCSGPYASPINGAAGLLVGDIVFEDCHWTVTERNMRKGIVPLFDIRYADGIKFIRNTVTWPDGPQRQNWQGFLKSENAVNVTVADSKVEMP